MTNTADSDHGPQRFQFQWDWRASLLALLLLPVVTSLGFWQLDRAEEKRHFQQVFEQRQAQGVVAIETLVTDADLRYQPVSLRGEFLNHKTLFLDNRIYQRRFGYEIITPFRLSANGQIVLVNRGWLEGDISRRTLPSVDAVHGLSQLTGDIYVPAGEMMTLADDTQVGWPQRIQTIDFEVLAAMLEQPLFPYSVRLRANSTGAYQAYWKVINMQPEKHVGYAFQWFAMGAMLLIIAFLANTNSLSLIHI